MVIQRITLAQIRICDFDKTWSFYLSKFRDHHIWIGLVRDTDQAHIIFVDTGDITINVHSKKRFSSISTKIMVPKSGQHDH